jgi:uncharacterized membrane protein SirB2
MSWFGVSLVFHLVGVGMIFTVLFAGPVIESNFRWENDVRMKLHSAKLLRSIGLLSPFGALVLVISGIGNMITLEITFANLFGSAAWLGLKLLIFIGLLALGMTMSPKTARERLALLEHLSQPNPPEDIDEKMNTLNNRQTIFFTMNWVLVLGILLLTVFKP